MTARKPGRPRLTVPNQRVVLTLPPETVAQAKALGDGSVSKGVRKALEISAGLERKPVDDHNA